MERQELPVGWARATVGELTNVGPKNECADETEVGFVPLQRLGVTYLSRHTHEPRVWKEVKKGYTQFQNGDVLLARITPSFENGKAGIARDLPNGLGAGSTEYIVFRPFADALDPRYLLAHFKTRSFLTSGEMVMTGAVGQQRVPKAFVLESQLPLAPLNEQRRIAAKLDITLAAVEACRKRLDGVAAILKRFRQAVLAAATSGELTREWREENSEDEPWEYVYLSSVADSRLGKMLDQSKNIGLPTPYLRNINVRWFTFDLSDIQSIRINDNERRDLDIRYGDLLVCEGGEPGRCAVWRGPDSEYTFQKALHRIRPSPLLAVDYLAYCIRNSADNGTLSELFTGTTIKHLTGRSLARYLVPLPSRKEQNEIIDQVEILFTFADRLETKLTFARKIVDLLTPALLAKAFRGELVPQDPNDEPVNVLLERIRSARNDKSAESTPSQRGRRRPFARSELSSRSPAPDPINDQSSLILERTRDDMTQGERVTRHVSKPERPRIPKAWRPMLKDLTQVLEEHQVWISASTACEELGISDGASSDDLELFYRQLKEQVESGVVDVQRRGDEDWLKLSSREVA